MNNKIWAFLIHLGTNCWMQKGAVADFPRPEEGFLFRDEMFCDKETWRKVVDFLPSRGINTLLIDVADGVCYDRHPEISIPGAWTKAELRAELDRLRSMGITPIPKCNFSSGHNAWLKEYAFMIGTPKHYEVCKDVIEELIELFDTPPFFHLGLEEDKDTITEKCLLTRAKDALDNGEYDLASDLQLEIQRKLNELTVKYTNYKKNLL